MAHYFIHALSRINLIQYGRYPYLGTAYEYDPYFYRFDSVPIGDGYTIYVVMSSTVKSSSSVPTAPVYLVPVTGVATENAQPAPASGNEAQASPVMYQMVYPSGAQPVMTVVTYPPQQYGPVKPVPDE